MTIVQVIDGRERDLGGFVVRRVLPFAKGIDVRPHPHIALATVGLLFPGLLEHRDSLGNVREITRGDLNWPAGSALEVPGGSEFIPLPA